MALEKGARWEIKGGYPTRAFLSQRGGGTRPSAAFPRALSDAESQKPALTARWRNQSGSGPGPANLISRHFWIALEWQCLVSCE